MKLHMSMLETKASEIDHNFGLIGLFFHNTADSNRLVLITIGPDVSFFTGSRINLGNLQIEGSNEGFTVHRGVAVRQMINSILGRNLLEEVHGEVSHAAIFVPQRVFHAAVNSFGIHIQNTANQIQGQVQLPSSIHIGGHGIDAQALSKGATILAIATDHITRVDAHQCFAAIGGSNMNTAHDNVSIGHQFLHSEGHGANLAVCTILNLHLVHSRLRYTHIAVGTKEVSPTHQLSCGKSNGSHRYNDDRCNNQRSERCSLHLFFLLDGVGCLHKRCMTEIRFLFEGVTKIQLFHIALHSASNSFLSSPLARWIRPRTVATGRCSVSAAS